MDKQTITENLKSGVCQVTFTKANGTERIMNCTLQEGFITPSVNTTSRTKTPNDEVVAVWDVDNNGWRSFRVDSITSFNVLNG